MLEHLSDRLYATGLIPTRGENPHHVVRRLGAVQSQDYPSAKWALGLRIPKSTDEDIEKAFEKGTILRTHVMRPTWHFVSPTDIRWMEELTSPRVRTSISTYAQSLGVTPAMVSKSKIVMEKALRKETYLTREEIGNELQKAGIHAKTQILGHLCSYAELDALICSGPRKGKKFTYALVEQRAPKAKTLSREKALIELTKRYFDSHGPATLHDFGWWSGLPMGDIRQTVEQSKLESETMDGKTYYWGSSRPVKMPTKPVAFLLPNYDEFFIGYKGSSHAADHILANVRLKKSVFFNHMIVIDGEIRGTWNKKVKTNDILLETSLFGSLNTDEKEALEKAVQRYEEFIGLPIKIKK